MNDAKFRAIYKCRLCGEKFELPATGEEVLVEMDAETHYCKDGDFGFADFLGFRKIEDNAKYYSEQPKVSKSYAVGETE